MPDKTEHKSRIGVTIHELCETKGGVIFFFTMVIMDFIAIALKMNLPNATGILALAIGLVIYLASTLALLWMWIFVMYAIYQIFGDKTIKNPIPSALWKMMWIVGIIAITLVIAFLIWGFAYMAMAPKLPA
ncbi:hypothetical protein COV53_02170 [Candidatus Gottesmanbacteria bacterium CG11_big_fil_rev_8_21_14_0_20_37_11]|uniref:Uncharacterized protein n=2 Tax=Candidatus Gottesmaniibacteriota TaxID=1752720 RepID=A0A2M7RSI6_9BACT|nr:MAG: hypothetical protein COX23_02270 [Candidatus Gottesmanbacteria bacterium CG23_combo_of_CG06-09_8_20_14_all_37_19]PIR08604.1 MAG: hypothetical protein COV53_02170 [Candidatus Gottesmanbacteria bacterium CG11_big_fil_rev_8_21_14_0_20_37_11]PIZ03180.1 MAG: hypothetical protein COY59_00900 [Candidatus Gottesmanbacteria bacterium CG_4_10_14_0_8_um_filter_37_24]HCX89972.1 hypothetical protein [Deltaproteobacteria bacterium]